MLTPTLPRARAPITTSEPNPDAGRGPLAEFLRSRRLRLAPKTAGVPERRRRRTPGLRREEVAEIAGIGTDWYNRLEQGRARHPSRATVDALARALRLDRTEHAHLRALAASPERPRFAMETVPPSLHGILAAIHTPAYVVGRRWDLLAWNSEAASLLGFGRLPEADRNILVGVLTRAEIRKRFGAGWPAEARRLVAAFHAEYDLWEGDPAFEALRERLSRECPEFETWWQAHDVATTGPGRKTLYDARGRARAFDHASFAVSGEPSLRLVVLSPAADGDR
jgi:transcriptional regulator with XRE-family HTH domain